MNETDNCIWVQTQVYKRRVFTDTILYCKFVNRRVDIYFYPEGKLEGTFHTLLDFETELPKCKFCRCNRQYIVNVDYIEQYSEKILEVVLVNGFHVQIAKERKEELFKLLGVC